jgi:site-specific recombinase
LIAGWVENYVVYAKLPERLQTHPALIHSLSKKRLQWLRDKVENNLGSIAGSLSLGFFLGMAGFVGKTLGIPFDIRHITIAAGNAAIGFYGLDHAISMQYLFTILSGIGMIGFLNFLVSFGLAFYVAVKSRGIRLKEYPEFLGILWRYFRKYPSHFIRASSKMITSERLQIKLSK